jgi:hypothetical protein
LIIRRMEVLKCTRVTIYTTLPRLEAWLNPVSEIEITTLILETKGVFVYSFLLFFSLA